MSRGEVMEREQTTIRLSEELMDQLKREAKKKGYTIKDLMIFILEEHFEKSIAQE